MRRDDFDNWRMRLDQLDEYVEKVRRAQRDFPALTIRLALEVDYLPGHEDWIRELARGIRGIISSARSITSPIRGRWTTRKTCASGRNRDAFEVWSVYFDRLGEAAESGLFEIIGHADLPKKFKIYPAQDCAPLFERFLDQGGQKRRGH